ATAEVAAIAPTGVSVAPGGQAAYVLATCSDNSCDGLISLYAIGADGSMTATGMTALTGSHVFPIEMITDDSGSSSYLLETIPSIDSAGPGSVYEYAIDSSGELQVKGAVTVGAGAVAEAVRGNDLYAVTSNAPVGVAHAPGGEIVHISVGVGGVLT